MSAGILQRRVKRRKCKARREKARGKGGEKRGEEGDILVYDCSEELETWENLSLWDRGLDNGGNLGDPDILGCYVVRSRYGRNVDICK